MAVLAGEEKIRTFERPRSPLERKKKHSDLEEASAQLGQGRTGTSFWKEGLLSKQRDDRV